MYNQPFFMPGYQMSSMPLNMARATVPTRGLGLFSRLGSAFSGLKKINWGGLINNTSKTLGIINQTIPLVRQVGPMFNNMRSMLKVASIFKDETDTPKKKKINNNTNNSQTNHYQNSSYQHSSQQTPIYKKNNDQNNKEEESDYEKYDNNPTFFINS